MTLPLLHFMDCGADLGSHSHRDDALFEQWVEKLAGGKKKVLVLGFKNGEGKARVICMSSIHGVFCPPFLPSPGTWLVL